MGTTINGVGYSFGSHLPKDGDKSFQFILVRLLIGPVKIFSVATKVVQSKNLSTVPDSIQVEKRGSAAFKIFASNYRLDLTPAQFIRKTISKNRSFYQDVLSEFSSHLIQSERKSHVAAFVFLYRLLERLSYSVPLLYTKSSHDFLGTFKSLQAMLAADASGELGFFKKFLNQGDFIDKTILDTTYTIDFSLCNDRGKHSKTIDTLFSDFDSKDPSIYKFTIKFRDVQSLLVTLRNRFLHKRTGDGQQNISIKDLGDPDDFFSVVNEVFRSFLAVVILHTIAIP